MASTASSGRKGAKVTASAQSDGDSSPCPVSRCADIVCSKWTVLVIRDLLDGPKYFRDLETSLTGISPRTLCERLKFLTEHGVVSRTYIKALPPRTQYALTEKGFGLQALVVSMREYGESFLAGQPTDHGDCA